MRGSKARSVDPSNELQEVEKAIDKVTFGVGAGQTAGIGLRPSPLRFARLVVPVDDSKASRLASAWARALTIRFGSHIVAAHVLEQPSLRQAFLDRDYDPASAERAAKRTLDEAAADLRDSEGKVELRLLKGWVVPRIAALVEESKADLVVAGSKGAGPWSRFLLGSTVDGLKNTVSASILIAKNQPPPRRILLATDGSFESKRAAVAALELARAFKASLTVLHVLDRRGSKSMAVKDPFDDSFPESRAPPWKDVEADFQVHFGRPAEQIVDVARKTRAGLIVMGSRGLSGIRSLVPGGVSNRVSHAAPCSVLLVKATAPAPGT